MLQSALAGLDAGGAYAMLAVIVVLMFRMVRVLNFALGAIGAFGTFTMIHFQSQGMALGLATIIGVVSAAALSAVLGGVIAIWFADARTETRSTVAIAMLLGLLMVGFRVFGYHAENFPPLFRSGGVKISGVVITSDGITILAATLVAAIGLTLFLHRTRRGLQLRAMAERPKTTELLGIPAWRLAVGVWAVAGALAALGTQIIAPTSPTAFDELALNIIPAFAAASLGLFRSFYLAALGGVAIGLIEGLATHYRAIASYQQILPLVVLGLVLIWTQRRDVWDAAR